MTIITALKNKKQDAERALKKMKGFVGQSQLRAIGTICRGEEKQFMFDKLVEYGIRIESMPKIYDQDGKGDNAVAYLHYFKGNMDWYITEKDIQPEQLQAFGLADLGNGEPEIGYISITELVDHGVELDLHFIPETIGKIKEFLHSARRVAAAAIIVSALSACASPVWEKPNATPAEFEQVKAECLIEGAQRVPVAPVYTVTPASSFSSSSCDKKGHNCSSYSTSMPPTVQQQDANAPLRDQVVRSCFSRKGWLEKNL